MATGKSATAMRRRERWGRLLARWKSSGLSQTAFCRRCGIPVWQFAWWKKRLADDAIVGEGMFVPLQVTASRSFEDVELTLGAGRSLRFSQQIDPARLAAIVAVLEGRSC